MKTLSGWQALLLSLVVAGCGKRVAPEVLQGECSKACEQVVKIRMVPVKARLQLQVHELDEKVESTEDEAKKDATLLKQQMAAPSTWSETALKKLTPAARRAALERHAWEENQLRVQRELSLKHTEESVAAVKKEFEDAKGRAAADEKKAAAAALEACTPSCLQRPVTFAQCLQRIQAVEDIAICEKQ